MAKKCMKEGGKVKKMAVGGGLANPNKPPTSFFNAPPRSMSPNNIFRSIPAGASLVPKGFEENLLPRHARPAPRISKTTLPNSVKIAAERKAIKKAKEMASGGSVSSASKRADGIATKGKTKGRMI
jgi:hypothetical protein